MTILEAINAVDELVPNTYDQMQKILWLSRLDGKFKVEVIDTHEGGEKLTFHGYNGETPTDRVLLIPEPYDNVYVLWLESQMHYADGEAARYNNANNRFAAEYAAAVGQYHRTHMPIGQTFRYV